MLGLILVYAAGAVTPVVLKPIARGAVKGTAKIGMGLKNLSHEAASELRGISAEASADVAAKKSEVPKGTVVVSKPKVDAPRAAVEVPKTSAVPTKPASVIVTAKK